MLSEEEMLQAKNLIDQARSGEYKIKQLYGDLWGSVQSKTTFGARFKHAVMAGSLPNIRHVTVGSDNQNVYEIFK